KAAIAAPARSRTRSMLSAMKKVGNPLRARYRSSRSSCCRAGSRNAKTERLDRAPARPQAGIQDTFFCYAPEVGGQGTQVRFRLASRNWRLYDVSLLFARAVLSGLSS